MYVHFYIYNKLKSTDKNKYIYALIQQFMTKPTLTLWYNKQQIK